MIDRDELRAMLRDELQAALVGAAPDPGPPAPVPLYKPHRRKVGKLSEPIPGEKGGTRYIGPETCRDCGGGLASLGDAMACVRIRQRRDPDELTKDVPGSGGVIECGIHYAEVPTDG